VQVVVCVVFINVVGSKGGGGVGVRDAMGLVGGVAASLHMYRLSVSFLC
jgi:hypothetical protein